LRYTTQPFGGRGEQGAEDWLNLEETGYFGSVCKKAPVDEQARRGVAIDGICAPTLDASWGWNVSPENAAVYRDNLDENAVSS
jgi:hypothetical protein